MKKRLTDQLSTIVLVLCATAITVTVVSREIRIRGEKRDASKALTRHDWRSFADSGRLETGPKNAPVTVVVFSDYTCRFCRQLDELLLASMERFNGSLRVQFRHFPRSNVPGARLAALAAECAVRAGRGWALHRSLFDAQDSIALLSPRELARRAGVGIPTDIEQCLSDESTAATVDADVSAAIELGVRVTPTMLVNERLVAGAPTAADFEQTLLRAGATVAQVSPDEH
jgi:protein-disulfide isomerase